MGLIDPAHRHVTARERFDLPDCIECLVRHRLWRKSSDVRSGYDIAACCQAQGRHLVRRRADIERRSPKVPGVKGVFEGGLVDQTAPREVNEKAASAHGRERLSV